MYDKNIAQMIDLLPKHNESRDVLFDPYFKQTIKFQKTYSEFLIEFYKKVSKESEKTLKMIDEELKK